MNSALANLTSQPFQEAVYGEGHDYRSESPHLKHRHLYDRLVSILLGTVKDLEERSLPLTVLEIGAGDGAFVQPMLAFGCEVTATEMSRPTVARLEELYARNPRFHVAFDEDGSLGVLGGERFSLIIFASVLHHMPDYLGALDHAISTRLSGNGSFISVQDPLWYETLQPGVHALSELAFLTWRIGQGNVIRGLRSRIRRLRGTYDDHDPSDVVEYHVVRHGVNERAIASLLALRFATVSEIRYWSTFASPWQAVGERLSLANTFAIKADGYERVATD